MLTLAGAGRARRSERAEVTSERRVWPVSVLCVSLSLCLLAGGGWVLLVVELEEARLLPSPAAGRTSPPTSQDDASQPHRTQPDGLQPGLRSPSLQRLMLERPVCRRRRGRRAAVAAASKVALGCGPAGEHRPIVRPDSPERE